MGKKDKKKKKDKKNKGHGKEKTEAKTQQRKLKQTQQQSGENVEEILRNLQLSDCNNTSVVIGSASEIPPSSRSAASLTPHPLKDELIMFGGESFDGKTIQCHNDLYMYNTGRNSWKKYSVPNPPPARSSHQAVALERAGGQLWVFGGEFTTPTGSQFRSFGDLWCLHLSGVNGDSKHPEWEEIKAPSPRPRPRAGHRMLYSQRKLFLFGGFSDSGVGDVTYHDDTWSFDLDTRVWTAHPTRSGSGPSPRSGFQFFKSGKDNEHVAFLYGGYHTARTRDVDRGTALQDMWALNLDRCTWSQVRLVGDVPSTRSGTSLSVIKQRAYLFGGVADREEELDIQSDHLADLYFFNCNSRRWAVLTIDTSAENIAPCPRRSALLTAKGNFLYLYGGVVEDQKVARESCRHDLFALEVGRANANLHWISKYAMADDGWVGDIEEDEDEEAGSGREAEDDRDEYSEEEYQLQPGEEFRTSSDEEEDVKTELPATAPGPDESLREFVTRTTEHWITQVTSAHPDEPPKTLRRLAFEAAREAFQTARDEED